MPARGANLGGVHADAGKGCGLTFGRAVSVVHKGGDIGIVRVKIIPMEEGEIRKFEVGDLGESIFEDFDCVGVPITFKGNQLRYIDLGLGRAVNLVDEYGVVVVVKKLDDAENSVNRGGPILGRIVKKARVVPLNALAYIEVIIAVHSALFKGNSLKGYGIVAIDVAIGGIPH